MPTVMTESPDSITAEFLRTKFDLGTMADVKMMALTGGVASDIWKVDAHGRSFVIKRALAKLRVAQDWTAPISRNAGEVAWMQAAASIVPAAVPRILAHDAGAGMFAMDYLEPGVYPVWKAELRAGRVSPAFAARVGATLAAIHAGTAGNERIAKTFSDDDMFQSIRLEPYLLTTARRHPDLQKILLRLAEGTLTTKLALVHGDVSPKNILVGPDGPVFLDAECAWYGDPAFDLAFCLNHMLLKCVWVPEATSDLMDSFEAMASAYLAGVRWEDPATIESRATALLPALMLARIDGKSPVEYITEEADKNRVRAFARTQILQPQRQLVEVASAWGNECKK